MASVFRRARLVRVSLGPDVSLLGQQYAALTGQSSPLSTSQVAFAAIHTIAEQQPHVEVSESWPPTIEWSSHERWQIVLDVMADTNKRIALGHLFTKPWFQRVWGIQEVGLARHARVHSGEAELVWQDVRLPPLWLLFLTLFTGTYPESQQPCGVICTILSTSITLWNIDVMSKASATY